MEIIFKRFIFVLIVNNIFYFNFQRGCVQTVTDEDKSYEKQDLDEAEQIDTNNQLFHERNIAQTDVPDYTVITYHCL